VGVDSNIVTASVLAILSGINRRLSACTPAEREVILDSVRGNLRCMAT
jgi:hypothetical protein